MINFVRLMTLFGAAALVAILSNFLDWEYSLGIAIGLSFLGATSLEIIKKLNDIGPTTP